MHTVQSIASEISKSSLPTTLFLGAGSSIPSGAPSGAALAAELTKNFFNGDKERDLADIAGRVELKFGRKPLIDFLRSKIDPLHPSKTVTQIPNFNFSRIFTTNYDLLVERAYHQASIDLPVVRSNKDYAFDERQYNTMLFKLHGCITEDRADGLSHGMILTDEDYSTYGRYRQIGFKFFEQSLATSNFVFVGYSMSDSNIKEYVERAIELTSQQNCPGKLYLLLYEEDEIEAQRWQNRGLNVAFGDLDRLLLALSSVDEDPNAVSIFSPVSNVSRHRVSAAISAINPLDERGGKGDLSKLVSGSAVTYSDIQEGFAFERSVANEIRQQISTSSSASIHVIVGPSGAGKSSAARLAMSALADNGLVCYEHKASVGVDFPTWRDIEREHFQNGETACVFFDEPNASQFAINQLATHIGDGKERSLSMVLTYHPSIWTFRTKSPALVKNAILHDLSRLTPADVNSIATHVRNLPQLARLLSQDVQSMTHSEMARMVSRKARSDLFVSLKYLFELRSLDEIVLKEFDQLGRNQPKEIRSDIRSLYETVSFLEAAGRHVHRQMVLRLSDVQADEIGDLLDYLEGVIFESERDDRIGGVYQWSTRHPRISSIIAGSKYSFARRKAFLKRIIESINPASAIERQFCAQLCNSDIGIESLPPEDQTEMYKLLTEVVPGERVPRHRLIRNLIRAKEFGPADLAIAEARDMRINDSVIHRYDVLLNVEKAANQSFLEDEDRLNLLSTAASKAMKSLSRRPDDKYNYESLCRATLALAQVSGDADQFDDALTRLRQSYQDLGDEQILGWIGRYESERVRLG